MARNAHKIRPVAPAVEKAASLRIAESGTPGFNPVGRLRLNVRKAFDTSGPDRWSPLSTSLFLLTVCGAFWTLVALALLNGGH